MRQNYGSLGGMARARQAKYEYMLRDSHSSIHLPLLFSFREDYKMFKGIFHIIPYKTVTVLCMYIIKCEKTAQDARKGIQAFLGDTVLIYMPLFEINRNANYGTLGGKARARQAKNEIHMLSPHYGEFIF